MDRWNNELNGLFAEYKQAIPDPDPGANFMPELWRKIEAKRSFTLRIRRLTQVFVGAAAAICLLFTMIEVIPGSSRPEVHGSYIDALAAAHPVDNITALGIVYRESPEPNTK
ncbi:MAG TPA: hypothetical protein VEU96_16115 [Bryobacteraceae bacterium]|nr:hypothetical protein [Bryobacteraceae bacterium]